MEVCDDTNASVDMDGSWIPRGPRSLLRNGRRSRQDESGPGDQAGRARRQADRPGSSRPWLQGNVHGHRPHRGGRRKVQRRERQGVLLREEVAGSRGPPSSRGPHLPTLHLRLLGCLPDVPGHDLRIGGEPVGGLHELPSLDLPDLHEPASLVVGGGDLHGGYQAAEGEVRDLLEARLHVGAADLAVRVGLEGVADGLAVERGRDHPAVVVHGRGHFRRRRPSFLPVHLTDLVQHWVVAPDTGELHRVVALGGRETARGVDVGFGRAPHERDHLPERVAHTLELLDPHGGRPAATSGAPPKRWPITKSAWYRCAMSTTCAPISTPGGGTANSLSWNPSCLARSSRTWMGSRPAGLS